MLQTVQFVGDDCANVLRFRQLKNIVAEAQSVNQKIRAIGFCLAQESSFAPPADVAAEDVNEYCGKDPDVLRQLYRDLLKKDTELFLKTTCHDFFCRKKGKISVGNLL